MNSLFPNGVPRNWRQVLKDAGISSTDMTRQDLWDLMNPEELRCSCGAPRPPRLTNTGRLETCGSSACRNSLKAARTEKTSLQRYGTTRPAQSAAAKEKQQATFQEKYGGHPLKVPAIQEKRVATNILKYGVATPAIESSRLAASIAKRKVTELARYTAQVWPGRVKFFNDHLQIEALSEFQSIREPLKWRHTSCGTEWVGLMKPSPHCPVCSTSQEQLGLENFLNSLGIPFERNTRSVIPPFEIDMYSAAHRAGIELNGMYWHRAGAGTPIAKKTELANAQGIRLMHISDLDWNEHPDIVKSHVRHMFNLTTQRIAGRDCVVREISARESRDFLVSTHLAGAANAKHHYGVFHEDRLVAVLTLGKPRWGDRDGLEIIRWSTVLNTAVRGGFTKALSHAVRTLCPSRIITYCDLRTGTGETYLKAGFTFKGITTPGYVWHRGRQVLSRQQAQKHLLPALLGDQFKVGLTEAENMEAAGWSQVFDAGHQRWEFTSL